MSNKVSQINFPLDYIRNFYFEPAVYHSLPGRDTLCAYTIFYMDDGVEKYLNLKNWYTDNLKKEVLQFRRFQIAHWIEKLEKPLTIRWMEIDFTSYFSVLQNNKFKPPGSIQDLVEEFEEKGFDSEDLLKDFYDIISEDEVEYESPVVQRAWVAGKLLTETNTNLKPEFNRESAYEILNYLKSFRSGKKAWHSGEVYHQKTEMGTYAHNLVAWKVIDDAEKAGVFTTFASVSEGSQDTILSEFVENNSEYVSYDYYVASKWGLPVSSPIFDVYLTSIDELAEYLREVCLTHNFHDVVEVIDEH